MVLATSARELELASKTRGLGRAPLPIGLSRIPRFIGFDRCLSKFAPWANCSWVRSEVKLDHGDQ
jgi:hypothetical protein